MITQCHKNLMDMLAKHKTNPQKFEQHDVEWIREESKTKAIYEKPWNLKRCPRRTRAWHSRAAGPIGLSLTLPKINLATLIAV